MTHLPRSPRTQIRQHRLVATVLVGVILVAACSDDDAGPVPTLAERVTTTTSTTSTTVVATTTTEVFTSMSAEAATYLEEALASMRRWSINRENVDWEQLEHSTLVAAQGAQTTQATYGAVRLALKLLDDDHSVLFTPAEAESFTYGEAQFVTPVVEQRPDGLGYVSIGRYIGDLGAQADSYASGLSEEIETVNEEVCGWLVDLRVATGGNMWPMLGGLSPLLSEGTIGAFTYPDGTVETWEIREDVVSWAGEPAVSLGHQRGGSGAQPPIAVIIGSLTGSSGEAVAVAFHGQEDVQFFGQSTAGKTTSNEPVELSDGAVMILTMSNFTDRHGVQYGQDISVEPDRAIAPPTDAEASAVEWLRTHPACTP